MTQACFAGSLRSFPVLDPVFDPCYWCEAVKHDESASNSHAAQLHGIAEPALEVSAGRPEASQEGAVGSFAPVQGAADHAGRLPLPAGSGSLLHSFRRLPYRCAS